MTEKYVFLLSLVLICVKAEWVKIPQISNTPKVNYKVQSAFSDLQSSSVLANSDVLSSVFSYDRPKVKGSTTEKPIINKHSKGNSLLHSTVTSKTINFESGVSDHIDREVLDLQPVRIIPKKESNRKVIYANHSMAMKTFPHFVVTGKKMTSEPHPNDSEQEEENDENDETLSSSEKDFSEEIYYEYEEEDVTTKAPSRKLTAKKASVRKPQRRVMQGVNERPKLSLSFMNFLKFIKNIQDTFTTRTAKNINDKIKMLRQFRDNLLITINQRIKSLWKTQTKTKRKSRTKRTFGDSGGGGWMEQGGALDFPSPEGALLSISFLTFAVFLIKLVLVR